MHRRTVALGCAGAEVGESVGHGFGTEYMGIHFQRLKCMCVQSKRIDTLVRTTHAPGLWVGVTVGTAVGGSVKSGIGITFAIGAGVFSGQVQSRPTPEVLGRACIYTCAAHERYLLSIHSLQSEFWLVLYCSIQEPISDHRNDPGNNASLDTPTCKHERTHARTCIFTPHWVLYGFLHSSLRL